jgi:hypothetical protein
MANETNMVKCAARALIKLSQENADFKVKVAQHEAKDRALSIAFKLAEVGSIEYSDILEKAASLAKEDLNVVEKAMSLNIGNILNGGANALAKEAALSSSEPGITNSAQAKTSFESFLLSNFS